MTDSISGTLAPDESVTYRFTGRIEYELSTIPDDIVIRVDGERWDRVSVSELPDACVLADGGEDITKQPDARGEM